MTSELPGNIVSHVLTLRGSLPSDGREQAEDFAYETDLVAYVP